MNEFPNVKGANLAGKSFSIPEDLQGDLNLLVIPFQRWQQIIVNKWISFFLDLIQKYPKIRFYEIPTLSKKYKLMQFVIDGGMRAGILDQATRERTITLYIDKTRFKQKLGIENENLIYVFLVNKEGSVVWKEEGEIEDSKIQSLESVLSSNYI